MTFFFRDMEERFTYDLLNRLTGIVEGLDTTGVFAYDGYGRMTMKYIHGDTVFDQTAYNAGGRPHALKTARMYSYQPDMSMAYTPFDKLERIRTGNTSLSYRYGYEHQRLRMDEMVGNDTVRTKVYAGNCEYVTEDNGTYSTSYWLTYISGPLGVFAVRDTRMHPDPKQMYYVHPDHLGSWTTITDESGTVEQRLSYDAWGNLRNPNIWSGSFTGTPMFDRGFTGHEHLYSFGLINMNGRMYDPVMSGFLSVDQYVQSPGNSQNFNRYAYCLNNPLRYVDPDGEEFLTSAIIIGSLLVGAYSGGVLTNGGEYNPIKWDWSSSNTYAGMLLGGVFGGLSGFAGVSIAGMGFAFCNTASIAASSLIYSVGMHCTGKCTNFDYGISLSIGVASFDFTHGKLGYLGKRGNSTLQNIGYGFGALANLQDIITGFDGGSYQYQYEKTKGNIGHANIRQVSYDADGETSTIVKISVANKNRIHAKNKLDWLWKCNFKKYSGGGEHWLDVPEQGWERIPLQLNTKIVDWMYHNLENGKGLWGITETRFGINYGCVSYAARALWTTGVPTIPMIN